MEEREYKLTRRCVKGLREDGEEIFLALNEAEKREVYINASILSEVLESSFSSGSTKILAMKNLLRQVESEEYERNKEVVSSVGSIQSIFWISEVICCEMEKNILEEEESLLSSSLLIGISLLEKCLIKSIAYAQKDRLAHCLEECGTFYLLNGYSEPEVLLLYSALLREEEPIYASAEYVGQEIEESMPYKGYIQENIYDTGSILVHRRDPFIFSPKYFNTLHRSSYGGYKRLFCLQDEYGIVHKALVKWCNRNSSLNGAEWAIIWHLDVLSHKADKRSYEKEILFVLGPLFFSSMENGADWGIGCIMMVGAYLRLLIACRNSSVASVRGASSVSVQRVGTGIGKPLIDVIASNKASEMEKFYAAEGLTRLCYLDKESGSGMDKLVVKHIQSIFEVLEIQPKDQMVTHTNNVLSIISSISCIPLLLFRPSCIVIVDWVSCNVKGLLPENKEWVRRYMEELSTVYSIDRPGYLLSGIGI
ncbi:hypothetical protein NEFER03_2082 [Nematocida sp. LUAm3]|nr:hypothetical protein NEFER03_2082 [Nematocida sp. LUAm3]